MWQIKKYSINRRFIAVIGITSCIALLVISTLTSCSKKSIIVPPITMTDSKPTITDVKTIPAIATPTQTSTIASSLPTGQTSRATSTISPLYDLGLKIEGTQRPIFLSTTTPNQKEFVYNNIIVTIDLVDDIFAESYLNLDDLQNNDKENSDIVIIRDIGNSEINYSFYPVNNAIYYYSDNEILNLSSCQKHLQNLNFTSLEYGSYGNSFIKGGLYCVKTNQGRIAIVSYIKDSLISGPTWPEEKLSMKVIVYNQIIE